MGLFPQVQSPCPYKGPLSDILEGDVCRLCKREVHDLNLLDEAARIALVAGCADEICVRYAVPRGSAIAAAALSAAAMAAPAFAQDAPAPQDPPAQVREITVDIEQPPEEEIYIIVGGLRHPGKARWQSDRPAAKGRELPVIEEPQDAGTPPVSEGQEQVPGAERA
jgi:hypothetical protein